MVLGPIKSGTESTNTFDQGPSYDGEVRHVVLAQEQLGVPGRLAVRVEVSAVVIDLVFVGIQDVVVGGSKSDGCERERSEQVIVIHERNKFTRCQLDCIVGCLGDVAVLESLTDDDPIIATRDLLK